MPIYRNWTACAPNIDPDAFVHPDAVVIGDVTLGAESSVWPGCRAPRRLRRNHVGVGYLHSGRHGDPCRPRVPDRSSATSCVVGHLAHLEGCILEDESLAGSGSVVLHWAVVGHGATVGANAVVPNRMVVPPGALALGVPAKVFEGRSDVRMNQLSAAEYVTNAKRYRASLRRVG